VLVKGHMSPHWTRASSRISYTLDFTSARLYVFLLHVITAGNYA